MGRLIIKLEDKYLEWTTITDSPHTFGMSLEEFTEYYRDEYGRQAMRFEFPERMQRVEAKGSSSLLGETIDDILAYNRAGKDETCLTKEQIIQYFIRDRNPDAELPMGTDPWEGEE
jgi:hypothetical protein